ncbi:substrate-binding domain-containing protein [Bosea sp. (in: a-proteobacteria)]|uniref:substrate-binding domain-containing protein n=1 Tax=Bosea sp. (in: a-proteobacteria) TaxID=1871050 RepID=UPI002616845F|nr:substrate-binding domain-containing protein [Bosea sp. (in: a-proteobacteria)]MCO5089761.1 substrate-binding domain-containing protein [Bosea sp. (in: a-proteobacteria)]
MPNEPVTLHAAGSLRRAFGELLPLFEQAHAVRVEALFGPAGLLRRRIEAGEGAQVFASANMEHPRRLFEAGRYGEPVCFARNEICALVRRDLAIGPAGLVDAMLDPELVLATSTPGADPSGDYAELVFARIDHLRPGAGAALAARARRLLGGGFTSEVPVGQAPSAWLIETGQADIVLGYRSGTLGLDAAGPCAVVTLPRDCAVTASYGLAVARTATRAGHDLAALLLSGEARDVLLRNGFMAPHDKKGER